MRKIILTVPAAALARERILELEADFRRTYANHFGEESLMVLWGRLPEGQSYVAGAEGKIYIAMIEVADGLAQGKREEAMMEFTRVFADGAGIPVEKPMVSVLDASKVSEYLAANRNRLRWSSRIGFLLGTLVHAFTSRRREGFASIRANL